MRNLARLAMLSLLTCSLAACGSVTSPSPALPRWTLPAASTRSKQAEPSRSARPVRSVTFTRPHAAPCRRLRHSGHRSSPSAARLLAYTATHRGTAVGQQCSRSHRVVRVILRGDLPTTTLCSPSQAFSIPPHHP